MQQYLPEGYAPQRCRSWDYETLQQAAADETLLQAPVLYCDGEGDLHTDLFPYEGLIPRGEVSLSGREGDLSQRELRQLVGRPVAFRVIGRLPDGRWLLSRAEAQRQTQCRLLEKLEVGSVLPAVVTGIAPFGVFCDIGCGLRALLPIEHLSVSRIRHPKERVCVGQKLFVAVSAIDRETCRVTLTHRELLGTWAENAALFLPGQTVRGIVRGVMPYGVFVELTPNLSALAEPFPGCQPGDAVSVFVKSVLPQRRKIKLTVLDRLSNRLPPAPFSYYITEGNISGWSYLTF